MTLVTACARPLPVTVTVSLPVLSVITAPVYTEQTPTGRVPVCGDTLWLRVSAQVPSVSRVTLTVRLIPGGWSHTRPLSLHTGDVTAHATVRACPSSVTATLTLDNVTVAMVTGEIAAGGGDIPCRSVTVSVTGVYGRESLPAQSPQKQDNSGSAHGHCHVTVIYM